jgi:hypothetical protein
MRLARERCQRIPEEQESELQSSYGKLSKSNFLKPIAILHDIPPDDPGTDWRINQE